MEIEQQHIKFLEDIINLDFFTIEKPLNELLEKEPVFLSDYLSMIYKRRTLNWHLNELIRNNSFFKTSIQGYQKNDGYTPDDPKVLENLEQKSEKILKKHFKENKEKRQNHLFDLMRRLWTKNGCPIWNECPGLPDANFGVGGCQGYVWCPVYNLGGSYSFMQDRELSSKGYKDLSEVPRELRIKKMKEYLEYYLKSKRKI